MSETRASLRATLIADGLLDLEGLAAHRQKPPLFEPGEPRFWDDPHIAQQMLKAHLDPDHDVASRRPALIDATVNWIVEHLGLTAGDALLDLGCGPGLYCRRFAERGLSVTGMDLSQNSLAYARQHDPATGYIFQNYLTLDYDEAFKTITLIYGDFNPLSDENRDTLLANVYRALQPGGAFVFDVTTKHHHDRQRARSDWVVHTGPAFWKPGPHMVLTRTFDYPEHDTVLEQYIVIEENGAISVYRNWFHYYSVETITAVLEQNGFEVAGVFSDLAGAPYMSDTEWIGLVARKT